jgi:AcrR family transcriptional regulator
VLRAAGELFAEVGLEAQMDEIAQRAGVGVGTVYRHFPTKEALIEALQAERWLKLAAAAEPYRDAADPWEGLKGFLWDAAHLNLQNRAWAELTAAAPLDLSAEDERQVLLAVTQELLDRAKEVDAVRPDLAGQDIGMLMCGTAGVMRTTGAHEGDTRWERFFELGLEGLRL